MLGQPASRSDPAFLSAGEALALFRGRRLSPVEVLQAQIARCEWLNADLKAFGDTYFDAALVAARQAEARYMKTDGRLRRLEGLTLAVKDDMALKGKRTTSGSLLKTEDVGTVTDAAVARLQKAGAIVHARSLTPEFCLVGVTHSRLWGVSRNPHKRDVTPGGSSGGSGAALAAGLTTLATGTDIGGSIRIPASACGIVGYLPPQGRIPDAAPYSLDWNSRTGPMARSTADCALMLNVMNGPHPLDVVTLRQRLRLRPAALRDIRGWKIAYSLDFGYKTLDADVRTNTLAALDVFRALGCTAEEVKVPWTQSLERIRRDYLYALWGRRMAPLLLFKRDELCDYTVKYIEASLATPIEAIHEGIDAVNAIYAGFGPMMQEYNLFVCPTLAIPAAAADHDPFDPGFRIDGVLADPRSGWIMTYPFNMLGRIPVLAVPSGRARNNVPTGIQIAGRSFDDLSVFRAAACFERALDFDVTRGLQ